MLKPIRSHSTAVFAIAVLALTAGCEQINALIGTGEGADITEETTENPETAAAPAAADSENPFRDAVNAAMKAAELAQTAKTAEEWQAVATEWKAAIDLMKAVPEGDANYAVAQQKATDYQKNLDYAQQNAGN